MKYIITEDNQVRVGPETSHHVDIAKSTMGKVNRAGHYEVVRGKVRVYGKSNGFNITAKKEDAKIVERSLPLHGIH